jgi:hypothetical protein
MQYAAYRYIPTFSEWMDKYELDGYFRFFPQKKPHPNEQHVVQVWRS